jgi:hypothetical protein
MELKMPQCDYHDDHNEATDTPAGQRCTAQATHRIEWSDGRRYSFGCDAHLEIDNCASVRPIRIVRLLTDEHRSLIAGAMIAGMAAKKHSLCCAPDALEACSVIIGKRKAERLRSWAYDDLGCCESDYERSRGSERMQDFLDKISELEAL